MCRSIMNKNYLVFVWALRHIRNKLHSCAVWCAEKKRMAIFVSNQHIMYVQQSFAFLIMQLQVVLSAIPSPSSKDILTGKSVMYCFFAVLVVMKLEMKVQVLQQWLIEKCVWSLRKKGVSLPAFLLRRSNHGSTECKLWAALTTYDPVFYSSLSIQQTCWLLIFTAVKDFILANKVHNVQQFHFYLFISDSKSI